MINRVTSTFLTRTSTITTVSIHLPSLDVIILGDVYPSIGKRFSGRQLQHLLPACQTENTWTNKYKLADLGGYHYIFTTVPQLNHL